MCSGKTRGVHQSLEHWRTRLEAQDPSGGDVVLGEQDQYHEEESVVEILVKPRILWETCLYLTLMVIF